VKGEGRARKLDFPTANLKMAEAGKILPANGVYAVQVESPGMLSAGALYIGPRPTFGGGANSIEVHLIGFKGSLYGRKMQISFLERIRDEAAFPDPGALREAIRKDVRRVKRLLST